MASLAWLAGYLGLALIGSDLTIFALLHGLAPDTTGPIDPQSALIIGTLVLADLSFLWLPSLLLCAVWRSRVGRLQGFQAALVVVLVHEAAVLVVAGGQFAAPSRKVYYVILAAKLIVPWLLGEVPVFRRKALDLSPPSRFRGLAGTYAFSAVAADAPAIALGRRHQGERQWILRRAARPQGWDQTIDSMANPPRAVPQGMSRALFVDRGALLGWAALAAGAVTSIICALSAPGWLAPDLTAAQVSLAAPGPVLLPLLALVLLRHGLTFLQERRRLLRLLREGRLVKATADATTLPGRPQSVVARADVEGAQLVVVTPAPVSAGAWQGLLVGPSGDVAAWDLLPGRPA